ncbi:succinate dehydrogenase cytochrome b subunit [Chitinophagaceae bacterium LB-8]|jgi:succinate dehydrogenase cytochrome b subunit|uniref:Succinate dehydrogenase cytochrome b subunit n=1 Tax=Paraflavisolibacter caeni TaxID=2982496 RepID=A0A9X3BIP3_9BACT|nr:succinate dehydrogenase cytochrome b subunit [Paraflavisolibacter caeni]MCU7550253.1 succinate dehydrogenase cytochrome b subunit [Paraflavisolibacter caeni]
MKWSLFFTSAIGKKIVMGLTGLFLITFLVIHVGLNACIFYDLPIFDPNDNGAMFNKASHFMGSTMVMRLLEIVLFAGFILHIIQGWSLELQNRQKRKQGYQVNLGNRGSKWYSRSMGILGTLIFLFLVLHISDFWIPSRITHNLPQAQYHGVEMHDMFIKMYNSFQNPVVVVLYLLGVLALAYHLFHGFHSAFRTMGVHNRKYLAMLKSLGYGFTIVVCVLFALMPIAMFLNWVSPL